MYEAPHICPNQNGALSCHGVVSGEFGEYRDGLFYSEEVVLLRALVSGLTLMAVLICVGAAQIQSLPYTPGLDVTAMDRTADPCVDFYAYACGSWQKNNPIPPDQSSWSVYSKMQDENRVLLRRILENAAVNDPHRGPINQKIGNYYAACIDETAINKAGVAVLKPDLDRIAAMKSKADLAPVLAYLHPRDIGVSLGNSSLFRFGSEQDAKNSAEVIAAVDQGGLGLPDRDYYLKDDARSQGNRTKYVAHVQKMFELAGDSPVAAATNAQTVMRIETALAKGSMTRVQRRDPNNVYHRMTVKELEAISPSFPWTVYFGKFGLSGLQSLNVAAPDYLKAMDATIAAEDVSAWQGYLRWHLLHAQARWLPTQFVEEDFNFYGRTMTGQQELQPRWKRCVRYSDRALGEALGQAFVEITFTPAAKQRTLTMVQQVEAAMQRDINQLTWMSPATKQQALQKLRAVLNKVGYPDHWRDYTSLNIVRGDAIGNGQRANQFEFQRQLNKIGKPVDRGEWYLSPATVNANYGPQNNDVNFPAGVLQPPAFDMKMDDAPNYGDTGGTIGHELTHGFDDEGRQFDTQGNLRDWWQPQDEKEFTARAQCIEDQYAQYVVVDDVKINSKLTLGEDVADLGGLMLAYIAWRDETENKKLRAIDGLTPEQRFFVGYAQSWCSNERPENQRMRAKTDPHSPTRYRTNGVVSNLQEFQQAFSCRTGQPMAPEKRCRVW